MRSCVSPCPLGDRAPWGQGTVGMGHPGARGSMGTGHPGEGAPQGWGILRTGHCGVMGSVGTWGPWGQGSLGMGLLRVGGPWVCGHHGDGAPQGAQGRSVQGTGRALGGGSRERRPGLGQKEGIPPSHAKGKLRHEAGSSDTEQPNLLLPVGPVCRWPPQGHAGGGARLGSPRGPSKGAELPGWHRRAAGTRGVSAFGDKGVKGDDCHGGDRRDMKDALLGGTKEDECPWGQGNECPWGQER